MRNLLLSFVVCGLTACGSAAPSGLVLGIGVTRVHGQVVSADVLGTAKNMEDCRRQAKEAYKQVPPTHTQDEDLQIGCAVVELQ